MSTDAISRTYYAAEGAANMLGVPADLESRLNPSPATEAPASNQTEAVVDTTALPKTEEAFDDVDIDLSEIEAALNTVEKEQAVEDALPEEAKKILSDEQFKALAPQFKEVFGLDLKEALTNYTELVQTTQKLQADLLAQRQEFQMQQQTYSVQAAWLTDPAFLQEARDKKVTINQLTEERITRLQNVYAKLSPEARQKLDAKGPVQAILELHNQVTSKLSKTNMPTSGPTGQTSNTVGEPQYKWSEIINWPADRYASEGAQLLSTGNFINDRNEVRRF